MKSNHVLEHLEKFANRFIFGFCIPIAILVISFCMPENFCERSSPLRASRKVMQFRLLFYSIRGLEDLRKAFQPNKEIQPEAELRLEILQFQGGLLLGTKMLHI